MVIKNGKRKKAHGNVLYTVVTVILISAVFLSMIAFCYREAEKEAYEVLHLQTKQIKDDLILQLKSDRENLATMASFASNLYESGEDYDIMFESFESIGLFASIGILNPDNTYITKDGVKNLEGKISFEEEAEKGVYVTGRVASASIPDKEVLRSAVPIVYNGETVGILYGVMYLETLNEKYGKMAEELTAQLFVYNKETGNFIIDTTKSESPGKITDLEKRKYNDGYSYDELVNSENGNSSFKSIFNGENLYVHYSTLEEFNWGIMLARYESEVFYSTHRLVGILFTAFVIMAVIMSVYLLYVMKNEKRNTRSTQRASDIRKLLLEVTNDNENIHAALESIREYSGARSAFFEDTDQDDYCSIHPDCSELILKGAEKDKLASELFRLVGTMKNGTKSIVGLMEISVGRQLMKTNEEMCVLLKQHGIEKILFAAVTSKNNHINLIGIINPKKYEAGRTLLKDIAICFSIAIYNKKHFDKTETAATTDSLTGVLNRASYKKDMMEFDAEKPQDFSCVYIDVNELHILNNKIGHAAGDEMLIYIANTLKDVFYKQRVYRIGGDEFLVFTKGMKAENVKFLTEEVIRLLKTRNYTVSLGISFRKQNTDCEELVKEAEARMYEMKSEYYRDKEQKNARKEAETDYLVTKTGIREIDAIISILKESYNGIYRVSLNDDSAHRILMPSYLGYKENEKYFSKLLVKYINDSVHPDFHRTVTAFLDYNAIKRGLEEGDVPSVTYTKVSGELMTLSVYRLDKDEPVNETLWIFAKG